MPAYKDDKTGKWFTKFYYTDWQGNNKQKWKRGFATKKEALAFEREFLEKQACNPDMTFHSLYESYIEDMEGRLKDSTIQHKRNIYETKILPFFGKIPVNEIKATDIRKWQTKLMKDEYNYKPTYLKSINNQMNCIMNYAKRFYDLNTDPCGKAGSMGRSDAEEMDFWTLEEYLAFREGIKDKAVSYLCFEVLYWTGMREGELLALTAEDINLVDKTIRICKSYARSHGKDIISTPKTKKSKRVVPIPDFLCQELTEYMNSMYMPRPKDRLFPYTKSYLAHEMQRGCKTTGIKKIRIHDLRHSHASLLINQGCDALMLADRLGHEKVSTTLNTYSHLFPHKQQALVHSLESLVGVTNPVPEPPVGVPGIPPVIEPELPKEKASGNVIQMPIRKII